jgi:large subunit ribosomal protein L32e
VRRRFRGRVLEPTIGNKQAKKTRHMLKSGFKKLLIRNQKDLELLLMNNRVYAGEIAQCLSAKTR